jgi:hypothetical protein
MNSGSTGENSKLATGLSCRAVHFAALAQCVSAGRTYPQQGMLYLACLVITILACAGCATVRYQERPFFLQEQGVDTHGRKSWFDRLVEFDPGKTQFQVAADYAQDPPRRIAILPFVDRGSANFVVNKIPLSFRNEKEQEEWAWTYANRLRRALTGYLAQREFTVVNLLTIDTTLADRGIQNWEALQAVPPQELGRWLAADTVVYGEVLHYEAYYAFLLATWQVGVQIRMLSTQDGHERFSAAGSRYSVDFRPAFTMMDIGINSVLTLLQLRDVTLARAEEEISREIVLRLPRAERNVSALVADAQGGLSDQADRHVAQSAAVSLPTSGPVATVQGGGFH